MQTDRLKNYNVLIVCILLLSALIGLGDESCYTVASLRRYEVSVL